MPDDALAADARTAAQESWLHVGIAARTFQRALRRCAASVLESYPQAAFVQLRFDMQTGVFVADRVRLLSGDDRPCRLTNTGAEVALPAVGVRDGRLHHPDIGTPLSEPLTADHDPVWLDVLAGVSRRLDPLPVLVESGMHATAGTPERILTDFVREHGQWEAWALDGADSRYVIVMAAGSSPTSLPIPVERTDVTQAVLAVHRASDSAGDRLPIPEL